MSKRETSHLPKIMATVRPQSLVDDKSEIVAAVRQQSLVVTVFRDVGIASDSVMTNFEQILETYSPPDEGAVMTKITIHNDADQLTQRIAELIENSRKHVVAQVNSMMVRTYFEIGRLIVENEQQGESRAAYGKGLLKALSQRLTTRFGKGFSVDNLERMRKFYVIYGLNKSANRLRKLPAEKSANDLRKSAVEKSETLSRISASKDAASTYCFTLSWSHYLFLMGIDNPDERSFYEIEAEQAHWSLKEMRRQFDSALYERLALSTDKAKVQELAQKGQIIEKPSDAVKDPYILEFLGLPEKSEYSENELETRIIDHLQVFLMEMGKGFTFVGRQVRFTFDEEHFKVDLVLYNRLLRCFVLIDLKIGKLKHQDLGQMLMYVNYYNRYEKTEDENPTIGILLCNEKSDKMVEMTLPEDSNIYASKYQLYLPDKKLLQEKMLEWLEEADNA